MNTPTPRYIQTSGALVQSTDGLGNPCGDWVKATDYERDLAAAQEARQAAEARAESYRQREETFRALIADDAYCSGFATLGEFRRGLIGWIDEKNSLDEYPEDGESPAIAGEPK